MVERRVPAHKIIFGSMRMHEYDKPLAYWVNLFESLYDLGIRTFHSSSEYESFPLYLEALEAFCDKNPSKKIKHIVKLAEPNFHLTEFDGVLLEQQVDFYLGKLNIETLHCVQWMWRGTLSDHPQRLKSFEAQYPKIKECILSLKSAGKIENFHCFPYDPDFAIAAIQKDEIDGLVVYRNVLEEEFTEALELGATLDKKSYIIRPLFGGKALESGKDALGLVRWALDFPNVEGAVLSISSLEKILQIL